MINDNFSLDEFLKESKSELKHDYRSTEDLRKLERDLFKKISERCIEDDCPEEALERVSKTISEKVQDILDKEEVLRKNLNKDTYDNFKAEVVSSLSFLFTVGTVEEKLRQRGGKIE